MDPGLPYIRVFINLNKAVNNKLPKCAYNLLHNLIFLNSRDQTGLVFFLGKVLTSGNDPCLADA